MTTFYAQNGSQGIFAAWSGHDSMWNTAADGSGSWLTPASLTAADILAANAKTAILLNADVTALRLSTAAEGGTAGGGFTVDLSNATGASRTVNANLLAGTTVCLGHSTSPYTGKRLTINGTITGGTATDAVGLRITNTGSVNFIATLLGNMTGGSGTNAHGVYITAQANYTIGAAGSPITVTAGPGAGISDGFYDNGAAGVKFLYANFVATAYGAGGAMTASGSDNVTWVGNATAHANYNGLIATYGIFKHSGYNIYASNGKPGVSIGSAARYLFDAYDNTISKVFYTSGGDAVFFYQPSDDALPENIKFGKVIDNVTGRLSRVPVIGGHSARRS